MTSKHLLWTNWVQQNKRYLWLYAANSILLLFYGPLRLLYNLSTVPTEYRIEQVHYNTGFDFGFSLLFAFLGVLAGIYVFSYLHSQKKVDFYHSQPISDSKRFLNIYISGLLCCYIPYIISVFLNVLIATSYGSLSFDMFLQSTASALLYMLVYFASYQIAVLMTIITGNILYSIALTGIAFVYELMLRKLIVEFSDLFFQNYSYSQGRKMLQCKWSAVWALLQKTENLTYHHSARELWEATGSTCILVAMISFATAVIAYFVYKKRPLEYTSPSLVFDKLKPVIKVLITPHILIIIFSIYYQNRYLSGSVDRSPVLFITTLLFLILGVCVLHVLFEFLWELNIQAVKKHFISTIFALECTLVFICSFYFDWYGYDTYVPNQENVESVGIAIDTGYKNYDENSRLRNYELNQIPLSCVNEACDAARELCHNNTSSIDISHTQTTVTADFAFHLKNGDTCYRTYKVIVDKGNTPLPNLLNNEAYKKATYPFLYNDGYIEALNSEKTNCFSWSDKSNHKVALTPTGKEQIKKLQQALLADFEETDNNSPYTFQDEHKAIGLLTVKYPENDSRTYNTYYLVFPEYTRTMKCLYEMGVTTDITTGFPLDEIESVKACTYTDKKITKTITDSSQIKELLSLVNNNWQPADSWLVNDYEIFISTRNSGKDSFCLYDKVPDWLTELVEK